MSLPVAEKATSVTDAKVAVASVVDEQDVKTVCAVAKFKGACLLLARFDHAWLTPQADKESLPGCQVAMDSYARDAVDMEIGLTRTSYISIYHQNVGWRLGQYQASGEFNFWYRPNSTWTLTESGPDEVVAQHPLTVYMNLGWLKLKAMRLLMKPKSGGYPGSDVAELSNCPDPPFCPGQLRLRIARPSGNWTVAEVAVVKLG
jgi:hypothetical protein